MKNLSRKQIIIKSIILFLHALVVLLFICGLFSSFILQQNFYFIEGIAIFLLYIVIMRCMLKKTVSFYMSDFDLIVYMYIPFFIVLGSVFYLNFENSLKFLLMMLGNK